MHIPTPPVLKHSKAATWLVLALALGSTGWGLGRAVYTASPQDFRVGTKRDRSKSKDQEYELKAEFLFNFAKYTTWPSAAFPDPKSPIILAVVGKDPFGVILEKVLAKKKVGARSILIKRYATSNQLGPAHMLFLGELDSKSRQALKKKTASMKALTVADGPGEAGKNTAVGFYMDRGKVRFEISKRAVESAGLTMSSQLLKLARLVDRR